MEEQKPNRKMREFRGNELNTLIIEFPVFGKIGTKINRKIAAISIQPAHEIVRFKSTCGMGYGSYTGWTFGVLDGKIEYQETFENIRKKQKELGMPDPEDTRAQVFLTGQEDMIVFVEEYKVDGVEDQFVYLYAYMCKKGKTFNSYPEVKTWVERPKIRKMVEEILD